MFTAALFILVKKWQELKRPSINEWINKTWFVHTIEYHLAIKMKELIHATTWVNLENIS